MWILLKIPVIFCSAGVFNLGFGILDNFRMTTYWNYFEKLKVLKENSRQISIIEIEKSIDSVLNSIVVHCRTICSILDLFSIYVYLSSI